MSVVTISGSDTLILNDKVFNDFADGDVSTLTFPNDLTSMKTGKNKNTIYAKNETGNNAQLVLRLVRGSADDIFLQESLSSLNRDFASFQLINGSFVKRLGDGNANIKNDVYLLSGGIFARNVDSKENVEGDTEQAVVVYTINFADANRGIE